MRFMSTSALVAVTTVGFVASASAATVTTSDIGAGDNISVVGMLSPSDQAEFVFEFAEDVVIDMFSVSGTGTNGGADLSAVTFGFDLPTSDTFDTVLSMGSVAFAGDFLPGGTYDAGSSVSIFFEDGVTFDVGLTVSFTTAAAVPSVPLPASGALLGLGLLGAFAMSRRKTM